MERGELRLVTDFAELRVGVTVVVRPCPYCGGEHRGVVVGHGRCREIGCPDVCAEVAPVGDCAMEPSFIAPLSIARRRVWRELDGLDQEAYDRELAVLEAQAGRRSRARTLIDTALDAIDHPFRHPAR